MPSDLFPGVNSLPVPRIGRTYLCGDDVAYVTDVDLSTDPPQFVYRLVDPNTQLLLADEHRTADPIGPEVPHHLMVVVHPQCYETLGTGVGGRVPRQDLKLASRTASDLVRDIYAMCGRSEHAGSNASRYQNGYAVIPLPPAGQFGWRAVHTMRFYYNAKPGLRRGFFQAGGSFYRVPKPSTAIRFRDAIERRLHGVKVTFRQYVARNHMLDWEQAEYEFRVNFPFPGEGVSRTHVFLGCRGGRRGYGPTRPVPGTKSAPGRPRPQTHVETTASLGELRAMWWLTDFAMRFAFAGPQDYKTGAIPPRKRV